MTGNFRYFHLATFAAAFALVGSACTDPGQSLGTVEQATMPSGFIPKPLGFGVVPGPVGVKTKVEGVEQELEAGAGDALNYHFIEITLVPGGQTGWHSHVGPEFVTVVEGTITVYEEHDPCHGHDVSAGEALMGNAGHIDIARNHTAQNARLVAMIITPDGVPPRIDEPAPPGADACP